MTDPAASDPWPYRLRLRGGRNTHQARWIDQPPPAYLITACGYAAGTRELDNPLKSTDCAECARRIAKENPHV